MSVKPYKRHQRGNMLILCTVSFSFMSLLITVAMSIFGLYFMHNRLQASAEEIALAGARKLNEEDRLGQMNNMIARCRQLVYSGRDNSNNSQMNYPHLKALADQLLEESRQSAITLEQQRVKLKETMLAEAYAEIYTTYNKIKAPYQLVLPWLQTSPPSLSKVSIGCINGIGSNVTQLKGFSQVEQQDKGYVHPKSGLYNANTNAKLPAPDSDLDFNISSLAPPCDNNMVPARLTMTDAYGTAPATYLTSAVQVELSMPATTYFGAKAKGDVKVIGTAASAGGGAPI